MNETTTCLFWQYFMDLLLMYLDQTCAAASLDHAFFGLAGYSFCNTRAMAAHF